MILTKETKNLVQVGDLLRAGDHDCKILSVMKNQRGGVSYTIDSPYGVIYSYPAHQLYGREIVKVTLPPYRVLWDVNCTSGAIECDTLQEAETRLCGVYKAWMDGKRAFWEKNEPNPCEARAWNNMLYSNSAVIQVLDENTRDYEDFWGPAYDDMVESLGWKEISVKL